MKKIYFPILLLSLLMAACSLQNPSLPEPTQPQPTEIQPGLNDPTTPTEGAQPEQNQAADECLPNAALMQTLRSALSYEQALISPINYGGERTFVVWFAAPSLNERSTDQAEAAAISLAVQAAKDLLAAAPCLADYDSLSFNVVDGSYWQWFTGSIRMIDIPDLFVEAPAASGGGASPADGDQGGGVLETGSCDWAEINTTTKAIFSPENQAALSYTRSSGGSQVSVYWRDSAIPDRSETGQALAQIAGMFGCLAPIPDGLSATITTIDGTLITTAYLPLDENGEALLDNFIFTLME